MIIRTSQDTIDFSPVVDMYNRGLTKWGIKLSGGADSALVAYMLVNLIQEENLENVELHAITGLQDKKPYNVRYAKAIMDKIEELTEFKFAGHHVISARTSDSESYITDQETLMQELLDAGIIQARFSGITANPTPEEAPELWTESMASGAPSDLDIRNRTSEHKPTFKIRSGTPLINTNKRGTAEIYRQLDIIDSLFPVTRSCESMDDTLHKNFTIHCGKCWMCLERKWGFGRLV